MPAPGERKTAKAILNGVVAMMEAISSIVLVAMMLLTFVDVVGRYLLGKPIFGASEMVSTMLALVIFSGMAIANARDKHIVVELFDARLRRLSPGVYDFIVHGFSILAMALIVYVLGQQAIESAHNDSRTIVLEWSYAWITGGVAFLALLSIISQVLGLMTGAYGGHVQDHLEDLS